MLRTRNGVDCTGWFPEVAETLAALQIGRTIVDGEIAVLDEVGRTNFEALQARAGRRGFGPGDIAVTYCVFDVLVLDGREIMSERLVDRKKQLGRLLAQALPYILNARHVDSSTVENPVSWQYAHALALSWRVSSASWPTRPTCRVKRIKYWFKLKRPDAVPPERFKHKRERR